MKRPSYKAAVEWIAVNDEPTWSDFNDVNSMLTVCCVADMFEVATERVTKDVLKVRERETVIRRLKGKR
jgi:hypothetical protein